MIFCVKAFWSCSPRIFSLSSVCPLLSQFCSVFWAVVSANWAAVDCKASLICTKSPWYSAWGMTCQLPLAISWAILTVSSMTCRKLVKVVSRLFLICMKSPRYSAWGTTCRLPWARPWEIFTISSITCRWILKIVSRAFLICANSPWYSAFGIMCKLPWANPWDTWTISSMSCWFCFSCCWFIRNCWLKALANKRNSSVPVGVKAKSSAVASRSCNSLIYLAMGMLNCVWKNHNTVPVLIKIMNTMITKTRVVVSVWRLAASIWRVACASIWFWNCTIGSVIVCWSASYWTSNRISLASLILSSALSLISSSLSCIAATVGCIEDFMISWASKTRRMARVSVAISASEFCLAKLSKSNTSGGAFNSLRRAKTLSRVLVTSISFQ